MTSEREDFQCQNIHDDSGPKRVEMDVCDQLFEISVLLTKDQFIAVLKKMSASAMPSKAGLTGHAFQIPLSYLFACQ